jgi:predicted transcriptional regulator YheO
MIITCSQKLKAMKTKADKKVEKVMHEFKEGTLKSGKDGKGGKVTEHKQAVAIALSESGQSKPKSAAKKKSK